MMTLQVFLRVSLCALLIFKAHGFIIKGSKSQQLSGRDTDTGGFDVVGGDNFAAHQGASSGHYAPMSSHVSSDIYRPGQAPSSSMLVQTAPAPGGLSSTFPGAGYPAGSGFVPVQAGYPVGASFVPAVPGYPVGAGPLVPVQSGYDAGAAQSSPPETKWTVEPKIFSEEGLANTPSSGPSTGDLLPPPPPPSGPVLQSGETSSVVKDAELGNYQQETEEIGYPASSMGPGQGFASSPMPYMGGYWVNPYPYQLPYPYPYPVFDYRLLYGLYPPGTYTTFSNHQEKGKDYYQNIHYLKEHDSGASDTPSSPGSGQYQKKIFPQAPQSS